MPELEATPWMGQMPACPICLTAVKAMTVSYDAANETTHYYAQCHGKSAVFTLTNIAVLQSSSLLNLLEQNLKTAWGWSSPVTITITGSDTPFGFGNYWETLDPPTPTKPSHPIVERLKAAADASLLQKVKRRIKFED